MAGTHLLCRFDQPKLHKRACTPASQATGSRTRHQQLCTDTYRDLSLEIQLVRLDNLPTQQNITGSACVQGYDES